MHGMKALKRAEAHLSWGRGCRSVRGEPLPPWFLLLPLAASFAPLSPPGSLILPSESGPSLSSQFEALSGLAFSAQISRIRAASWPWSWLGGEGAGAEL